MEPSQPLFPDSGIVLSHCLFSCLFHEGELQVTLLTPSFTHSTLQPSPGHPIPPQPEPQARRMSYYPVDDLEGGLLDKAAEFAERQVRAGFVRKVFGLLTVQLGITVGITALFL